MHACIQAHKCINIHTSTYMQSAREMEKRDLRRTLCSGFQYLVRDALFLSDLPPPPPPPSPFPCNPPLSSLLYIPLMHIGAIRTEWGSYDAQRKYLRKSPVRSKDYHPDLSLIPRKTQHTHIITHTHCATHTQHTHNTHTHYHYHPDLSLIPRKCCSHVFVQPMSV
jgi:hypothetical protein